MPGPVSVTSTPIRPASENVRTVTRPPVGVDLMALSTIMEVPPNFQLGPNALQRSYVKSQTAGMVPLSELVTQHTTLAPLSVNHQGQFPSVTLTFNLRDNCRVR